MDAPFTKEAGEKAEKVFSSASFAFYSHYTWFDNNCHRMDVASFFHYGPMA
jgi:hypothetical protein